MPLVGAVPLRHLQFRYIKPERKVYVIVRDSKALPLALGPREFYSHPVASMQRMRNGQQEERVQNALLGFVDPAACEEVMAFIGTPDVTHQVIPLRYLMDLAEMIRMPAIVLLTSKDDPVSDAFSYLPSALRSRKKI